MPELYDWLRKDYIVNIYSGRLTKEQLKNINPDLIVSYNYKYIITKDVIDYMDGNIINLHSSYLSWNKGANPNFWSFVEDTPKDVTIHQIDKGLDTGKILYQKECHFDIENETFASTYDKLNQTMIALFKAHWDEIRDKKYQLQEQSRMDFCVKKVEKMFYIRTDANAEESKK